MAEPLKDQIDASLVKRLAKQVVKVDAKADAAPIRAAAKQLPPLELKDRVNLLADALAQSLSGGVKKQLKSVQALTASKEFEGLTGWPFASFIERHGLAEPVAALAAMESVTEDFTCRFALRPFLVEHLDLAMEHVHRWTQHDSEHPRRLASEGTRPNLPWAPKVPAISADPVIGLAVLQQLRHDPSEYVRRSVANHLNDVAKAHPKLVVETLRGWSAEPDTQRQMVSHALRTLVKNGDVGAMEVLGFTSKPKLTVASFSVTPEEVTLGQSIALATTVTSTAKQEQKVVVDFVVHHVLANGSTSPKVFKWTALTIAPGQAVGLAKTRKIATASTRRYHAGFHKVELQIAGKVKASGGFSLPKGS